MVVLGSADVIPKVDGLHVLDGQDARRHPCRLARASLNQSPGSVSMNRALLLHNKSMEPYKHKPNTPGASFAFEPSSVFT